MRRHDLEALEYPQVLAHLAELAQSPAGAALCRRLRPLTDGAEIALELERTWQCFRLLETEGSLPDTSAPDIGAPLTSACRDGFVLEGPQLVQIARALELGRQLGAFLRRRAEQAPALQTLADRLRPVRDLEEVLARALDPGGLVRDDASEELAALRATIRKLRAQLTRRLEALVARPTLTDVVAEQYVTIRNNRFVIPVRAHYGQKLQGIVQDRSASGETVFIEPLFAVEMNNALLMTAREEDRVVRRILADLTALVRGRAAEVADVFAALTAFDTVAAKARFGRRYHCTQPRLTAGALDLRRARHPTLLLAGHTVVPVDLHLPADKHVLVITGPNTGGKTVALKTAGLLCLMAQTGMLVPAAEGSAVPCWQGVYADIGDEQSIQRNLSTFSAHVSNLVEVQRRIRSPALILLDEPGVGTDPEEGAALAIGLLQALGHGGVRIIATTHYAPVKLYALTRRDCLVSAVDFDRTTLEPRYRLLYHSLGESLALPIAERLGLGAEILAAAHAAQSEEGKTVAAALSRLEAARREYESRAGELSRREEDLQAKESAIREREGEVQEILDDLRQRRRQQWRAAFSDVREFVRGVKDEGRRILAELEAGHSQRRELDHFARAASGAISRYESEARPAEVEPGGALAPGDTVELSEGGFRGELLSVEGDKAWIRRGTMRVEVPAKQLRFVAGAPRPGRPAPVHVEAPRPEAPAEVTLVGMRAKEALARLEGFLDRAAVAGHASVRVIHGVGSGALRRAVHDYLEVSPYCGGYRAGDPGEGGAGVTVVELGR